MSRNTIYNKQTNEELISKVEEKNIELMDDFLDYLKSIDRSPQTMHGYKNDLLIFFVWNELYNHNKFFIDLSKRDIIKYQSYLININNSPNRIRRLKSSLSSLSDFIENILDEDYPNFRNIINKIESPANEPTRKKTIMSEQQIKILLDNLVKNKKYMQACIVALAKSSGARKAELIEFKVSYFNKENIVVNGALYKTPEKIRTKGRGSKGKQLFKYTFVKEFQPYLDLWIKQRKELNINSEYLFVNKQADGTYKQITIYTLNSWAISFSKILNIDFYWHSLRHYWTTSLKSKNLPDSVIVALQGWNKVTGGAMVAIYNDEDIDESLSKFFSSDGVIEQKQFSLNDI